MTEILFIPRFIDIWRMYSAISNTQERNHAQGAMTDIFKFMQGGAPRAHWSVRVFPLQGLDSGHFIGRVYFRTIFRKFT